ncbi:MAG: DALR anticodon-binding domain-containing protein, partial [Candidatus Gracilibacteria bacterium]
RKSKEEDAKDMQKVSEDSKTMEEKTRALIKLFPKFAEIIIETAREYKPNILCSYLYDLAQKFNSFYNSVPVLTANSESEREFRLKIVESASQILKNGLNLLGIKVIEEM